MTLEKLHTQSLTHSPSLFDVPGIKAFASEKTYNTTVYDILQMKELCLL